MEMLPYTYENRASPLIINWPYVSVVT